MTFEEKKHFLANTCFQTINPQQPDQLTDEEEEVVATLLANNKRF